MSNIIEDIKLNSLCTIATQKINNEAPVYSQTFKARAKLFTLSTRATRIGGVLFLFILHDRGVVRRKKKLIHQLEGVLEVAICPVDAFWLVMAGRNTIMIAAVLQWFKEFTGIV